MINTILTIIIAVEITHFVIMVLWAIEKDFYDAQEVVVHFLFLSLKVLILCIGIVISIFVVIYWFIKWIFEKTKELEDA